LVDAVLVLRKLVLSKEAPVRDDSTLTLDASHRIKHRICGISTSLPISHSHSPSVDLTIPKINNEKNRRCSACSGVNNAGHCCKTDILAGSVTIL